MCLKGGYGAWQSAAPMHVVMSGFFFPIPHRHQAHHVTCGHLLLSETYLAMLRRLCPAISTLDSRVEVSVGVVGAVARNRRSVGGADHADGDLEAMVAIAGQGLCNIAEQPALRSTQLGHAAPAQDPARGRLQPVACA